ncbi:MAG: hypothetical protein WCB63_13185 [Polyangiales bacterium]
MSGGTVKKTQAPSSNGNIVLVLQPPIRKLCVEPRYFRIPSPVSPAFLAAFAAFFAFFSFVESFGWFFVSVLF